MNSFSCSNYLYAVWKVKMLTVNTKASQLSARLIARVYMCVVELVRQIECPAVDAMDGCLLHSVPKCWRS